jgi:hypothetical protein
VKACAAPAECRAWVDQQLRPKSIRVQEGEAKKKQEGALLELFMQAEAVFFYIFSHRPRRIERERQQQKKGGFAGVLRSD